MSSLARMGMSCLISLLHVYHRLLMRPIIANHLKTLHFVGSSLRIYHIISYFNINVCSMIAKILQNVNTLNNIHYAPIYKYEKNELK